MTLQVEQYYYFSAVTINARVKKSNISLFLTLRINPPLYFPAIPLNVYVLFLIHGQIITGITVTCYIPRCSLRPTSNQHICWYTKLRFINGVDNVNWPPYRDWKADIASVSPSLWRRLSDWFFRAKFVLRLVSASRLKLSLQRHPLPLSFAVLEELCTSQSKSAPPPLSRDKCVALKTVPVCGVVDEICFFNARIST